MLRLLFLGDIVGRPGRQMVKNHLPRLRQELELDVVLANAENAAGGFGLSAGSAWELHRAGIDGLTSGNHIWKFPDIIPVLEQEFWIVRPANYPDAPGQGLMLLSVGSRTLAVLNLLGRTFMDMVDCPFQAAQKLLAKVPPDALIIVDMHAEATSEKRALLHLLRGQVQLLVGTHTHVQTNDACIVDRVTGYISDLGMCGPEDSCLGMDNESILRRFQTGRAHRFSVAAGPAMLNGVLAEFENGCCQSIQPWRYPEAFRQEEL